MADHYFTRDFSIDNLGPNGDTSTVPVKPDGKTIPQFFTTQVKNIARTQALGVTKYDEVEMVRIFIPGDKHNVVERRVTDAIRQRYPKHYAAFKKTQELAPEGTLIDNWPLLARNQVYELKAANVFTLEQLAGLSDEQLGAIGIGGRALRNHAKAYLENAEKGRLPAQVVAENESLKNQVQLLTQQIGDMARRMEQMMVKAGDNPADAPYNPVSEARVAVSKASGVDLTINIPDNYTALGLPKLKEIVAQFSSAPVRNKDEALTIIEEYLGKKSAVAA